MYIQQLKNFKNSINEIDNKEGNDEIDSIGFIEEGVSNNDKKKAKKFQSGGHQKNIYKFTQPINTGFKLEIKYA